MSATMIVKHKVKSFEQWKQVFDGMEGIRKRFGWLGTDVLRDAADPNLVTIINHVGSIEQAKAYGGSPELKEGMAKAGVDGRPEISFNEDVETRRYQ